MKPSASSALALWVVWDGADHAVLGRSDRRALELGPRSPDCECFAVRSLDASGEPADLLDFFWVRLNRAFTRPLIIPRSAKAIEVSLLGGAGVFPFARYYFDPVQNRAGIQCEIVFAQVQRDDAEKTHPIIVANQTAPFAEAARWLEPLQRNRSHSLIWAVAAPFEDLPGRGIIERRVAPLSSLFPRPADLIKVNPVRYHKEEEDQQQPDEREPAIRAVAREERHVISLEIDAPLTEVSDTKAVPGLVVFHYMRQRQLIRLWSKTSALLRFTAADLEQLDGGTYPFAKTERLFVAKPLRAHEGLADGLRIRVRKQQLGDGLVHRFTTVFAFASLGDVLIILDMAGLRLAGPDGAARSQLTFCVGAEELEYRDASPRDDPEIMAAAIEVVEPGFEGERPIGIGNPNQALVDRLATQVRTATFDFEELGRRPLIPLFVIAYAAHARHATQFGERLDYSAFARDPGVVSAAILTTPLPSPPSASIARRPSAMVSPFFALRLAAELGVSTFIMSPSKLEGDVIATDLLTSLRNRPLWENAAAVGVKIDPAQQDADLFIQQLKDFRAWCDNPDIVDELAHSGDPEVSSAFLAFLNEQQPYQRPLAAPDFVRLYTLIQPVAIDVESSATAAGATWMNGPTPSRDMRSTDQLKADYSKLLKDALAHDDPTVRSAARRHAGANYTYRKQMHIAEKELKDLIGSPAISRDILALIDRLESWAGINGGEGSRGSDERRQRILNLARALRAQSFEISPASQLGREMRRITQPVEAECHRLRPNAASEDGDILTVLPSYARLLGFHAAHRALTSARTKGSDLPEYATRLLSLWPDRADICWDKHLAWSASQAEAVSAELAKPWLVEI